MRISNKVKELRKLNRKIRLLKREFAQAVMRRDYETADKLWAKLDIVELGKEEPENAAQ